MINDQWELTQRVSFKNKQTGAWESENFLDPENVLRNGINTFCWLRKIIKCYLNLGFSFLFKLGMFLPEGFTDLFLTIHFRKITEVC